MGSKCSFDKQGNLKITFDSADEALVEVISRDRNHEPGVYYTLHGNSITMHQLPHEGEAVNDDHQPGGLEANM